MRRLDRAADRVNPFLIVLIIGLLVLNLARLATLGLANFPITRVDPLLLDPWLDDGEVRWLDH